MRVPPAAEEAIVSAFADEGCLGIESRSTTRSLRAPRVTLVAWFSGRRGLAAVTRRARARLVAVGLPRTVSFRAQRVGDGRWVESWQKSLRPMPIGRRILALPEGCAMPSGSRRIVIRIPFGQAFGTGEHASTRLSLRLLERHLAQGDRVADLGTGTGILAVAAGRLGAGAVLAVDSDPIAVRVARETLARNGMTDAVDLRRDDAARALEAGPFDLALVNIGATVIGRLLPGLARSLVPGGRAILAGILVDDEGPLAARAGACGFEVETRLRQKPWSALLVRRT